MRGDRLPEYFVNDSGRNFSPIFTKFRKLIAEVIFKAEFVFDRKRKYFARIRGSRISVFCAIYSISLSDTVAHGSTAGVTGYTLYVYHT